MPQSTIDPYDPDSPYQPIDNFSAWCMTSGIDWEIGSPFPPDITVNVELQRNITGYNKYKVKMIANVNNTLVDIIDVTDGTTEILSFEKNTGFFNQDVFLKFKNLDSLAQGNYFVEVIFNLYGVTTMKDTLINSASVYFDVNVTGQVDQISVDDEYSLIFDRQNNTLTGDLDVEILNNTNNVSLGFFNNLEIFKNINPVINDAFTLAPKIPLSGNTNIPLEGEYNISSYIYKSLVGGQQVKLKTFNIQLFVLNSNILISPALLTFSLQQINSETKSDIIKIINPNNKPFTISAPYWLTLSASSGTGTANITATTLNSSVLPVGETTGVVTIVCENKTYDIPVKVNVISFIYMTGLEAYNFCLDQKILNFNRRELMARFVRSTLSIKFRSETETVNMTVPLVVPYFKDKASFDIGKKMHQYFLRYRKSVLRETKKPGNFDNKIWLYPAEVSVKVEELDVDYNVVHTDNVGVIKFYPGKKPKAFPLLSDNLVKQRVAGSKYIFSYIQGMLDVTKISMAPSNQLENGLMVRAKIEDDENKIIFTKKKVFDLGANKKLEYYTLPNTGPHIIHIQYENQNLCPEAFSFTGHFKKNPEFTHVYSKSVLTALQEKYDVSKTEVWNMNTGFILKKCIPIISQIIESKLVYVEFDNVVYRGFIISQKLVSEDTSLELVQFELEFLLTE